MLFETEAGATLHLKMFPSDKEKLMSGEAAGDRRKNEKESETTSSMAILCNFSNVISPQNEPN